MATLRAPLNVLVINFIDILSHARTESRMVRELAGNESAYRSITLSWFRHTPIKELFRRLASLDYDLLVTTDHGSIRVDTPSKVVGDRNVNTNLRYKMGKNLSYNAKEVYEFAIREPFSSRSRTFRPPTSLPRVPASLPYPNNLQPLCAVL